MHAGGTRPGNQVCSAGATWWVFERFVWASSIGSIVVIKTSSKKCSVNVSVLAR